MLLKTQIGEINSLVGKILGTSTLNTVMLEDSKLHVCMLTNFYHNDFNDLKDFFILFFAL